MWSSLEFESKSYFYVLTSPTRLQLLKTTFSEHLNLRAFGAFPRAVVGRRTPNLRRRLVRLAFFDARALIWTGANTTAPSPARCGGRRTLQLAEEYQPATAGERKVLVEWGGASSSWVKKMPARMALAGESDERETRLGPWPLWRGLGELLVRRQGSLRTTAAEARTRESGRTV